MRENFEEAGVQVSSSGTPERAGWSEPFVARKTGKTHCTALFVLRTQKDTVAGEWAQAYETRRKICNWFCAHSWYKFVPFINQASMNKEKAMRETRNGHFLPLSKALEELDKKSQSVLRRLLALGKVRNTE